MDVVTVTPNPTITTPLSSDEIVAAVITETHEPITTASTTTTPMKDHDFGSNLSGHVHARSDQMGEETAEEDIDVEALLSVAGATTGEEEDDDHDDHPVIKKRRVEEKEEDDNDHDAFDIFGDDD
jgi:hypothetical protein